MRSYTQVILPLGRRYKTSLKAYIVDIRTAFSPGVRHKNGSRIPNSQSALLWLVFIFIKALSKAVTLLLCLFSLLHYLMSSWNDLPGSHTKHFFHYQYT